MRKVVLLVAASIMFATSLPVSAKMHRPCLLKSKAAWDSAFRVCLTYYRSNPNPGSAVDNAMLYTEWQISAMQSDDIKAARFWLDTVTSQYPDFLPCEQAIMRAKLVCEKSEVEVAPLHLSSSRKREGSVPNPPIPRASVPSAGLLETTPGLSPQGPASMGTPAFHSTIPGR